MGVTVARFVLDTNIILYFLGGRLADSFPAGAYAISVISELSFWLILAWFLQRNSVFEISWRTFLSPT